MTATADVTRRQAWLMAARPQTLPAGGAPVVIGVALAVADGVFAPLPAVAALVGALLIQIGTNFANDYYDAVNGADTEDREGFTRVTAGGLIDPPEVKRAMIATYVLSLVVGLYLVYVGGLPILVVGLSSIVAGILYTGGPYPYGYYGLGDLFVFVYFGVVAVTGTYYVQAVTALGIDPLVVAIPGWTVTPESVLAGVAAGALATCILVVNNIRDRETDAAAGKRTLAVLLGYRLSRVEFCGLLAAAYAVPVVLWAQFGYHPAALAPTLSLPLAVSVARVVVTERDGSALNPALERTGQLLAVYALLLAAGLTAPVVI
ncbi:1,4-dihydroxy-2-naphthoate polyprenyltransferase [Halovenus sp. WSH3]|uniref:1,4-dihydroxy-2-naphthoate octaprenyltransferase n=1 Tax=Halovenus carboxidivorans TaxID=2692199 RepID=A0A6B0T820_9EURY|nr:1,4-dihydroxy-2-naphthoate polyprenyltransferase [Halovenus carboxidivorans]MXR51452.1 1,4-dihydroxy-2-naphthoate polyprenyltransferase [Halovenus carboxidivorans]